MDWIDLRSDTVTVPTPAMREAMASALVGDDVYGEDPTVNQLEAEAAARFGREAGLFVTSGTMGNLTSVLTHCGRGDEMIIGRLNHIVRYEVASAAAYGGVQPMMLDVQPDGTLDLKAIREALRDPNELHFPQTRLICLENTHGSSGAPLSAEYTRQVAEIAHAHGAKLHIDGARIFNAAAALDTPVDQLTAGADTVTFCLSKGLCAPVGSVIVGSEETIHRARKIRKSLGGGMRQAGILAAAGLIALREMSARLKEDHANARLLAEGIATIPYLRIDLERVKSNMVFFDMTEDAPLTPAQLSEALKAQYGILLNPYLGRERTLRALTHYYVTPENVELLLTALRTLLTVPAAEHASL